MELPTVCIKNLDAKSGFTRINESDFDPNKHELFGEAPSAVEIPDDWEMLHHTKIINLATAIKGGDFEVAEGQTKTDAAKAVIQAKLAERPSLDQ